MSALSDRLERLDRRRAKAWADVLEGEFPTIRGNPGRVQGIAAVRPYLDRDRRSGIAVLVDGKAYVVLDGHPKPLPVLSDEGFMLHGHAVRVLTTLLTWRAHYMVRGAGWLSPGVSDHAPTATAPVAGVGQRTTAVPTAPGGVEDRGPMDDRVPLARRGWFHLTVWAISLLVVVVSAMTVPRGSPARDSIQAVLAWTCFGLVVTAVLAWRGRRRT